MEHGKLEAANSKSDRDLERKRPKSAKHRQIPALRSDDWNLYHPVVALSPSPFPSPPLRFPRLLSLLDLEMTTVPFSDDGIGIANLPNQVSCLI